MAIARPPFPQHRRQLWRPITGRFDCGPRTWQHAIDKARRDHAVPGIEKLRRLAVRPGAQPTNVFDAERVFRALDVPYERIVGGQWSELVRALRRGHGIQLCIAYGPLNDLAPWRSGDPRFRGGHSIYIRDLRRRRRDGIRLTLSYDSLYDGRRQGIPDRPMYVRLGVLRRAAGAFAGVEGRWWGGIIADDRRVAGPGGLPEPDVDWTDYEPEEPAYPEETADQGVPFPYGVDGHDLEDTEPADPEDEGDELPEPDEDDEA